MVDPLLTLDFIFASCSSGPILGAKRRQLIDSLNVEEDMQVETALRVWVVDFLMRELPGRHAGILIWAKELDDIACGKLADGIMGRSASPSLAISGGRFISVNWVPSAFDLEEGALVGVIPIDIFETRVFNLRLLYKSCIERQEKNGSRSRPSLVRP